MMMNRHFDLYEDVLKNPCKYPRLFDLIVITAINSEQKSCYEHQLAIKLARNRLPARIPFRVISDPDEHKLNSGGSTLHLLASLATGSSSDNTNNSSSQPTAATNPPLSSLRILLIHAGGYSQRSPSCSVLGKLFSPVACAHAAIEDMLDLKLANHLPFALNQAMRPGVLLVASDDFESFDFEQQVQLGGMLGAHGYEFVLIAHKSSLQIAKDHGVYVLDKVDGEIKSAEKLDQSLLGGCKMVLQKPSIEKMKHLGIVLKDENEEEYVHTDSFFYFTHRVTQDLLEFHAQHFATILSQNIEIDAYRDFLQPLGSQPLSLNDYLASQPAASHQILTSLYELFRGRATLVVAPTDSKFFHFGTVNELLDLFLNSSSAFCQHFRHILGYTRLKSSYVLADDAQIHRNCCIINSRIGSSTRVNEGSILEFCMIADGVRLAVGKNCYLSNCCCSVGDEDDDLQVPDNICLHTIPIKPLPNQDKVEYVTIFFDRRDDLKKVYERLERGIFLGREMRPSLAKALETREVKSNCLWDMRVFRAYDSMSESFRKSLSFVNKYLSNDKNLEYEIEDENRKAYSLFDLLKYRSYSDMISFRLDNKLF